MVAAGSGTRMGSALPKQFLPLLGKPVLAHSIAVFQQALPEALLLLPVNDEFRDLAAGIAAAAAIPEKIRIISGGHNRYSSVAAGVAEIKDAEAIVFVHDGVRCLVTEDLILRCEQAAIEKDSAIPFMPVHDSLRRRSGNSFTAVDRSDYGTVQTPQTFRAGLLQQAFRQPFDSSFTDEATVVEKAGFPVNFIPGEDANIKLTRPVDLLLAESILAGRIQKL